MKKAKQSLKSDAIIFAFVSILLVGFVYYFSSTKSQKTVKPDLSVPFLNHKSAWVDSLMNVMTIEEKIGQLIISENSFDSQDSIKFLKNKLISENIGGFVLNSDSLENYLFCVNDLIINNIPPFLINKIGNGTFDFFKENLYFPLSKEILMLSDSSTFNEYCRMVSSHNKKMHNNIVVIPGPEILDSYSIVDTAFIEKFLQRIYDFSLLIQNDSLISCLNLPASIFFTDSSNMETRDYIFKAMIKSGISSFYLKNDSLNSDINVDYLVNELEYNGLLIADLKLENNLEKLINGNIDLFVVETETSEITKKIRQLLLEGKISEEKINQKVRKVLLAKSWSGLEKPSKTITDSLEFRFNYLNTRALSRKLFQQAAFITANSKRKIPIVNIENKYQIITIGKEKMKRFEEISAYYSENLDYKFIKYNNSDVSKNIFLPAGYSDLVVLLNDVELDSFKDSLLLKKLNELSLNNKLIVIDFCNYKNFAILKNLNTYIQLLGNLNDNQLIACEALFGGIGVKSNIPYKIFNNQELKPKTSEKTRLQYSWPEESGILAYDLSKVDSIVYEGLRVGAFPGCQVFIAKKGKIIHSKSYGYHSYNGREKVNWNDLYDIASVTKVAATTLAVMKMIDLNKMSLNDKLEEYFKDLHIEYTRIKPDTSVTIDTLLLTDIQNLEKFVRDKDTIRLNDSTIVVYDTLFSKVTPKLNIFKCKVRELLMHKSGLSPAIPILRFLQYRKDTVLYANDSIRKLYKEKPPKTRQDSMKILYNKYYSNNFIKDSAEVKIADGFFLRKDYFDTLWVDIKQIRVYSKRPYVYSDANMIILQLAIDSINKISMDKFLEKNIYKALGLQTTCFSPLKKFSKNRIVPTENDKFWRRQILHGYVHDPSSALMGCMTGNAGLFTSAHDLGILFQMLINKGVYGGKRFINENIVKTFITAQPDSHRGLGFDMAIGSKKKVSKYAPRSTFGHLGYTGTCVWADPENEIVYVFLSNRPHPSDKNWKLNKLKIRERIHDAVYEALSKSKKYKTSF